jgi:hypothetical protein
MTAAANDGQDHPVGLLIVYLRQGVYLCQLFNKRAGGSKFLVPLYVIDLGWQAG